MELYEKSGNSINVYELKELKDKLFEYKRKEMEKMNKDEIVYKVLSNNSDELNFFLNLGSYDSSKFITKDNKLFKHKNGLKLKNYNYVSENRVIIDGYIYGICAEKHSLVYTRKQIIIYDGNGNKEKVFIPMTYDFKFNKKNKVFDGGFYEYELPFLVSIPESIQLLEMLKECDYYNLVDKNIDEQLALFEFIDKPVAKLDINTINYFKNNVNYYLYGEGLEVSQNILKKVRRVHN